MAYTNVQSGEIPEGTQYYSGKLPLGDYNFYLKIDATGVSPKIVAQCESPDGELRTAASRTLPAGTHVLQWSVEANETEASVYAKVKDNTQPPDISPLTIPIQTGGTYEEKRSVAGAIYRYTVPSGVFANYKGSSAFDFIVASAAQNDTIVYEIVETSQGETREHTLTASNSYTYGGKTVWYAALTSFSQGVQNVNVPYYRLSVDAKKPQIAWAMIYGDDSGEKEKSELVARFAINLGDAGGYPGGGGGWVSPGDWNPDPTTTLHLAVNGALSGRHSDPLNDASFSYVPADKETVKGYGTGGDGGNGGGGGAGASTIIVRQFATNKANSKEILALAKRHGYGSGGGKGGKGGDGCILIYY